MEIKSKAKMFHGLIPTSQVVRGKKFTIKSKIRSMSETNFSGVIRFILKYPAHNYYEIYQTNIELKPGEECERPQDEDKEKATFDAFSEGWAIVEVDFPGHSEGRVVDENRNIIPKQIVKGFHVASPQDINTFYALWTSIMLLLIMIGKEIILNWRNIVNFFNMILEAMSTP
jgi:hypothetical protein